MILGSITGCRTYDGDKIRQEHAAFYPEQLAQKTDDILVDSNGLDLYDCIRIAMDNSLDVRSAELQQRIAKLDQRISFANFLPAVSLGVQKTWWDPLPAVNFGGTGVSLHDKDVREVTWNIQMSVFNPATWFMYNMHTRGYEISELATEYTRQAIALQVTAQYYQCLALEQMVEAMQSRLAAARGLAEELMALHEEGMIPAWQADQGHMMVFSRQAQLRQLRRSLNQAKADLLATLGLSPMQEIILIMQMPLVPPEGALEDLIVEAMLQHPRLAIADRQIAIDKEKIKMAIADFLPQITGFAQRVDTTDSHQVFSNYWLGGVSGVITVFNGFANINQYKAAKAHHQAAFIQREQAALSLMIQVIRAQDQVEAARDQVTLTDLAGNVVEKHVAEFRQQQAQGLVSSSDLLDMVAEADRAGMQRIQAQYQYQTSVAVLMNVMGRTQTHFEESTHEAK
jgi:outer membrane protein TolC